MASRYEKRQRIKRSLATPPRRGLDRGRATGRSRGRIKSLDNATAKFALVALPAWKLSVEQAQDFVHAKWLVRKGNLAAAIPLLSRIAATQADATSESSRSCQAWRLLGTIWANRGHWDQAATAYEQVVLLQPNSSEAQLATAAAWLEAGRLETAAQHCQRALALENTANGNLLLATIYFRQQNNLPRNNGTGNHFVRALMPRLRPSRISRSHGASRSSRRTMSCALRGPKNN